MMMILVAGNYYQSNDDGDRLPHSLCMCIITRTTTAVGCHCCSVLSVECMRTPAAWCLYSSLLRVMAASQTAPCSNNFCQFRFENFPGFGFTVNYTAVQG